MLSLMVFTRRPVKVAPKSGGRVGGGGHSPPSCRLEMAALEQLLRLEDPKLACTPPPSPPPPPGAVVMAGLRGQDGHPLPGHSCPGGAGFHGPLLPGAGAGHAGGRGWTIVHSSQVNGEEIFQ